MSQSQIQRHGPLTEAEAAICQASKLGYDTEAAVIRIVDVAPPLTERQREQLRLLLDTGDGR